MNFLNYGETFTGDDTAPQGDGFATVTPKSLTELR